MVTRATRSAAAVLALAVVGCSTSVFDDRQGEAWSDSNGAEGISANSYGGAVAGVTTDRPGATIVGLGIEPVGLTVVRYDESGSLDLSGGDLQALADAQLTAPPTLLAAPQPIPGANGLVAVGGLGALDQILLYDVSSGTPVQVGALSGADCGAPGLNLGRAMTFAATNAGADNVLDLVAVRGSEVFLFPDLDLTDDTPTCLRCSAGSNIDDVAAIEIGFNDGEEILIHTGSTITVFDGFQVEEASGAGVGCFDVRSPQISNLNGGGDGSRIAIGDAEDDGFADVVVTNPLTNSVFVIPNLTQSGPGGVPHVLVAPTDSGAFGDGPVVMLDIDGDDADELVVGDPAASPDGVSGAGQASVFKFSDDGEWELRGVLFDSTPETDQQFGRSLSVAEFVFDDDADLLVAGANGELFTYFRAFANAVDPRQ